MLRVHTLAKELGVPSKTILAKCAAEGIELKNHMAAISAGLAESIREWFSVGADVTSVEVADPVDLEKVRKSRSRAASQSQVEDSEPPSESAPPAEVSTAVLERPVGAPVEAPVVEPPPPAPVVHSAPEPGVAPEPPAIAARKEKEVTPEVRRPTDAPQILRRTAPPAVMEPPRPKPVMPAGPQVVPRPAELRGPRVVRVEMPEPVRPPRPRPSVAPVELPSAPGGPPRGRGRGRGRTRDEEEAAARARSPRRQDTPTEVVERIREWRDQDVIERKERLASATGHGIRDRRVIERRRQSAPAPVATGRKSEVEISTPLTLKDFCAAIGVPYATLMNKLMQHTGKLYTINQMIDAETAELLALEQGITLKIVQARTELEKLQDEFRDRPRPNKKLRPPVVAMLGHVDHGKTSLLDAIRRTNVAKGEAGGITQRVGAYRIDRGDWHVTFLDTPGHQAFTSMRARGANLTDVVVLVVAADDGIMPQTVEAINHARAANVPIVVALNKIDLPGIDLNKVYASLAEHDLTPTEWGGHTDVIKTSAHTGQGIDDLIAHLSTLSELLHLEADPTVPVQATVVEAQMRGGRGVVAQVLVREGTLEPGKVVVCGPGSGKIRALVDDRSNRLKEAGPGTPVEISGLDELPEAGDTLYEVGDISRAKAIAAETQTRLRESSLQATRKPQTLEELLTAGTDTTKPVLNVILRADVQGRLEPLRKALGDFSAEKARLNILHAGVGTISEADVRLAQASRAVIIGFDVIPEDRAQQLADQVGVEIRTYRVIYEIVEDLQQALEGLLAPERREEARGKAEVRQVFNVSRLGTIAGCLVVDGVIARSHKVRLVRDGRIVLQGAGIGSLKRFKDDAREVRSGLECGIKIEGFDDVKPGDVIESFEVVEVAQRL